MVEKKGMGERDAPPDLKRRAKNKQPAKTGGGDPKKKKKGVKF